MGRVIEVVLRTVIVAVLAGSLGVQVVIVPLLVADLAGAGMEPVVLTVIAVFAVLGVATVEVCAICVWRLLTLVRRGTVFSARSFGYVDTLIGAISVAALLVFAVAVMLAPGDAAPGVVGLICGAALIVGGVALIVVVLRALLVQAIARDTEAAELRTQLSEVI